MFLGAPECSLGRAWGNLPTIRPYQSPVCLRCRYGKTLRSAREPRLGIVSSAVSGIFGDSGNSGNSGTSGTSGLEWKSTELDCEGVVTAHRFGDADFFNKLIFHK